jgi:hypothetical protein
LFGNPFEMYVVAMHGLRTFSIFSCAAAFQLFLVAAIADLPQPGDECRALRASLAEKLGLQDSPELHEVFGIADRPTEPHALDRSRLEFGCIQE